MSEDLKNISIIIADDHPFYRDGLMNVLKLEPRFKVVAQAADGVELLSLAKEHEPDLLIVDISMPNMTGIDAVKKVISAKLKSRAIALTMHSEDNIILQMLDAGAMGYLDKNTTKDELFEAIESVAIHDKVYFPASTRMHMFELLSESNYKPYPDKKLTFSEREVAVIKLVCQDFSSKDIGDRLEISARTVETHRIRIMERMGVRSVAGLVAYAYSHKIVLP
jgi:DNA-binding NarL/FixJ family response regulator